jgi:hypothetical protein
MAASRNGCMNVAIARRASLLFASILVAPALGCSRDAAVDRLIEAIKAGDDKEVEALVKREGIDLNRSGRAGSAPLLQALISGNKEAYTALLKRGADPDLCDDSGKCTMNQAAKNSDPFWLMEALAHGGDPNALNVGNRHSPKSTPIIYAIHSRQVNNVRILIEAGANVNHRAGHGLSPLREAAGSGKYEAVVFLLESGADPLQPDNHGYTLVKWFEGRTEDLVPEEDQKPWYRKARSILVARELLPPEEFIEKGAREEQGREEGLGKKLKSHAR